jgi:hypothetical protein
MRRVFEHPDEAAERGRRGRETIVRRQSVERLAEFVSTRVAAIEQMPPKERKGEVPVERAARFIAVGPSLSWTAPSGRFGRFGVLARRTLLRVLRPYLVRQREWESLVVEQLRLDQANAKRQAERIEQLEGTLDELQRELRLTREAEIERTAD